MSDYIKTEKVLDLLAGVVAEIIKMPPETHDKRTETHSCDNERTETHGDLISRKEAINAVCSVCGDTECNIFDPDNKAKLYCPLVEVKEEQNG